MVVKVPWNENIVNVEQVKTQRYQYLARQIVEMYQAAGEVVYLVVGSLRTISRNNSASRDAF